MRLVSPRFSTMVAALSTVALGFLATPAFAGNPPPGECANGDCGTPKNNGGGCGCGCGGSILVDYTDEGKTYEQSDDSDHDGIDDALDNCPFTPNPDQLDTDGDGVGDVCDNCVDVGNHNQDVNACGDLWTKANHIQGSVSENIGQVKGAACDLTCTPSKSDKTTETVALGAPGSSAADDTSGTGIPKSGEVACSATAGPTGSVPGWALGALGLVSLGGLVRRRRDRKAS